MANPQLENGHTRIANEVLEKLARMYLPPNQWQVLLCIIRKTYGFHKKVDWIANSQIIEATGLVKSTVSRSLKALDQQGLISRTKKSIGFQKDWERWKKVSSIANKLKLAEQPTIGTKLAEQPTDEKLAIQQQKLADRKLKLAIQPTKVSSTATHKRKKDTYTKEKRHFYGLTNILLSEKEHEKLVELFGEEGTRDKLTTLSLYKASKGKRYESDYATVLSWHRRDAKGGQGGTNRQNSRQLTPRQNYTKVEDL